MIETEQVIMIAGVIAIWYSDKEIKFRKIEKKFGLENCHRIFDRFYKISFQKYFKDVHLD